MSNFYEKYLGAFSAKRLIVGKKSRDHFVCLDLLYIFCPGMKLIRSTRKLGHKQNEKKKKKGAKVAALKRGYRFSSPKGEIFCISVEGTFPENFVQIRSYLLYHTPVTVNSEITQKCPFLLFCSKTKPFLKN